MDDIIILISLIVIAVILKINYDSGNVISKAYTTVPILCIWKKYSKIYHSSMLIAKTKSGQKIYIPTVANKVTDDKINYSYTSELKIEHKFSKSNLSEFNLEKEVDQFRILGVNQKKVRYILTVTKYSPDNNLIIYSADNNSVNSKL